MTAFAEMTTTALTSWYGSNRMLAQHVGTELDGCAWVLIPFAGSMCEIPYIRARTILACDLHRHLINLARVVSDPKLRPALSRRLRGLLFHPDELEAAQARCKLREAAHNTGGLFGSAPDPSLHDKLEWAADYFVCSWMGRGGRAGTKGEFDGGQSLRWDAGGGDSNARFRSAIRSLIGWHRVLTGRCNFVCGDGFELIEQAKDVEEHGIYPDPPFPKGGDPYRHTFNPADHHRLAKALHRFTKARVVVRYYDHPLIRELYPESRWTWVRRVGRKATNDDAPEVLLINGPSYAAASA